MMIYFDHAATTVPFSEALEAFSSASTEFFGNSNSKHDVGRKASRLLEECRQEILDLLHLKATHNLCFTSGASEGNNLAIKGIATAYRNRGNKIIVSAGEHPSVLSTARQLRNFGYEVVELPLGEDGVISPEDLLSAMDKNTILVSIMAVNNETGAISDIAGLSSVIKKFPKAFFHVDATQAIGKVVLPLEKADILTFSGHKFGGVKGTGAICFLKKIAFTPLISGGDQELGFRSGTVSVPGAYSLAVALKKSLLIYDEKKLLEMKRHLLEGLSSIKEIEVNSPEHSIPGLLNISFREHKASVLVEALSEKGIYVSSISACSSKGEPISYVLQSMGKDAIACANSMRISYSNENNLSEIDTFLTELKRTLSEVKPREL